MKILVLDRGKFNTMCCFFELETRKCESLNAATERNYSSTVFQRHEIDLVVMDGCGPKPVLARCRLVLLEAAKLEPPVKRKFVAGLECGPIRQA